MPNLTFTGEYFRYEIQEIDKDDAKEYIENGIDEGDLEDMDFSDEAEQGISGEILLTLDGSQLATLQIEDLKVSSVEPQPDYWHILKLEHGRRGCICGPLEIEGAFDREAVKFSSYVKKMWERLSTDTAQCLMAMRALNRRKNGSTKLNTSLCRQRAKCTN